jgi:hypothetical protein
VKVEDLLCKLRESNPELAAELAANPDKNYVAERLQELTGHLVIDLQIHNPHLRRKKKKPR